MASSLSVSNIQPPTELNILTFKKITLDGIEYAPYHSSEGIKVPVIYPSFQETRNQIFYMLIPKEEIVKCIREYLPEIIDSSLIKSESN